ncbi:MAG: TldD/PmbA family protein, partial [Candidatus Nitrosocaldaceae archaeon]
EDAKEKVKLAYTKAHNDKVYFDTRIKPEDNIDELLKIAKECYAIMRVNTQKSSISIGYQRVSKLFMNSESANIVQEYTDTTAVLTSVASEQGLNESTSTTEGGRGGIEMLENVRTKAEYISSMASKLVKAKPVKESKSKVILNPDFVALLTHEILGHPSEADRVLGYELAWAGGAWWAGKLGSRIGSSLLSVIDDPTIPSTLGNYKYDDEGVIAREKILIKDGILVDHMYSRETALKFDKEPNASMRASDAKFMPLIRMACTYIKPRDYSYQEMIKEVKDGYLVCDMKVPSIDMFRYNWSISAQYAYKIEQGELKDLHRDVIIMNNALDFFNSIDACSKEFEIRPILNCGKGDPMQIMRMGNGGPYIRGEAIIKSVQ